MSPASMVAALKKLEGRTLAVEQILPTLATKEDLKAFATKEDLKAFATKEDIAAVRAEMAEKFQEAKTFARVLHEDLKGDIALIAEHLSEVMTRLPPRSR